MAFRRSSPTAKLKGTIFFRTDTKEAETKRLNKRAESKEAVAENPSAEAAGGIIAGFESE